MNIGMYIHIPFRISKHNHRCTLSFFNKDFCIKEYFKRLNKEILMRKDNKYIVDTLYIGGGDPVSVDTEYILELVKNIKENYKLSDDIEMTIEINPICPPSIISKWIELGFNRFSIKPITFDKKGLEDLELFHNLSDVKQIIKQIRKNNLNNINIDMYFAYPGQTIDALKRDIKDILSLDLPHISYYSMKSDEEDSILKHSREEYEKLEELESEMIDIISDSFEKKGYDHHEINHFSKKGFISKHAMKYWNLDNYLAFGLGASGLLGNFSYKNHTDFDKYFESIKNNQEPYGETIQFSNEEMAKNYILSRLGLNIGIDTNYFKKRFGFDILDRYGNIINSFIEKGVLKLENDNLYFTKEGKYLSNELYMRIL